MKFMYRIPEATEALGISRSRLYELLAAGQIESVHVGRTRLIPAEALEEYVDRLREAS